MSNRIFIVDVEATDDTPATGVMTEFGIVDFETQAWFHGRLWRFHPDPEIPAKPIADVPAPGFRLSGKVTPDPVHAMKWDSCQTSDRPDAVAGEAFVMAAASQFVKNLTDGGRATFVSDNNGYDFMWMAYYFDKHGHPNPFGHSSRRIGDLAAGLSGNWRKTSAWKKYRRTAHDHNPVNDALGNAEAYRTILTRHEQKF
ncbi:hypothetical protein [Aeromicrobium sp. 179-A 4D2 NHS]|uniref:hypothetical protein n=1 Tax=Aeromicrobium sp. 179-A 4D2 NHS TaxID=3142375 RepID=UPI0039A3BBFA